jgi:ubiquinol-cytochrome c reductase iron-sulfur subunit
MPAARRSSEGRQLADTTQSIAAGPDAEGDVTRRDFLLIATGAFAAVGAAASIWPLIDQMNPDAAALALSSIEVDTSAIQQGQAVTVMWRGKPVVIRYRTEAEMQEAQDVPLDELRDPLARNDNLAPDAPATDANRTVPGREEWMVMVKVCTHLGCIPLGESGEYGGWFCPCHGSQYDTAGRIRRGPAPENMLIPPFQFIDDTVVRIG